MNPRSLGEYTATAPRTMAPFDASKRERHDEKHRAAIRHLRGGAVTFVGTGGSLQVPHMIGGGFSLHNGLRAAVKAAKHIIPVVRAAAPIVSALEAGDTGAAVDAAVAAGGKALTNKARQSDVMKRLKKLADRPEL